MKARPPSGGPDAVLFPPGFLRLLATVPSLVRRVRVGAAAGAHAARAPGGPFLLRGHRPYRPGDDVRRIDWPALARLDRVVVREHDVERDARTEVWLDGSASLAAAGETREADAHPDDALARGGGARGAAARAAALACAVGLCGGGTVRLGVLRAGEAAYRAEASGPADLPALLHAIAAETPAGKAGLSTALPAALLRCPPRARCFVVSDLLTDAPPDLLLRVAGRGVVGGILHLRDPDTWAPRPGGRVEAVDAETGVRRVVVWSEARAARVAARAAAHAARWAHAASAAGLVLLPFAPATPPEDLLLRIARAVP